MGFNFVMEYKKEKIISLLMYYLEEREEENGGESKGELMAISHPIPK